MNIIRKKKVWIGIILFIILCGCIIYNIQIKNKENDYKVIVDNIENENANEHYNISNDSNDDNEDDGSINNDSEIIVHIIGEVNNTGVFKLKQGQRIVDAIEQAGGTTELADLSKVNLAYVLSDGQQINIPSIYEDSEDFKYITDGSGEKVITDNKSSNQSTEVESIKVNINNATQSELETLSGIGPSLANKIIEYRKKNGGFKKLEELKEVSGIGEAKFESIKKYVTIR